MTEDQTVVQDIRKTWVSPVVIEASTDLETEAVGAAGSDGTIS